MTTALRVLPAVAAGLWLLGCGGAPAPLEPLPAAPTLATVQVGQGPQAGQMSWDGVVEAVQQARVSAQTSGRVLNVEVDVHDAVQAGQVLLRLSDVEQQAALRAAQAQRQSAEAAWREAELRLQRVSTLADRQLVARAELDQVVAGHAAVSAQRDAARAAESAARQQLQYTVVRAPYAGVVQSRAVEPGEAVGVGQTLLSVMAPGELRVVLQLPQALARRLAGQDALQLQGAEGGLLQTGPPVVFPSADPLAQTLTVRATLPAAVARATVPGASLRVLLPRELARESAALSTGNQRLRVPQAAVVQRGEVTAVYVVADGRVSLRQVRLGAAAEGQREVLAGLRDGEQVATDPLAALAWLGTRHE